MTRQGTLATNRAPQTGQTFAGVPMNEPANVRAMSGVARIDTASVPAYSSRDPSSTEVVRKFQANTLMELYERMAEYQSKEVDRLLEKGKELQADLVRDKVDTVAAIAAGCRTPDDVAERIESIFSDDTTGVVLSSVHRAKGLEADRVFILHPELIPHPKARQDWELEQEQNCLYVALTRSKSELYLVESR
ncbi:MAG: 3'-5' exonuclease [Anaerolineales bacterium]